jgi:hypothetical protein
MEFLTALKALMRPSSILFPHENIYIGLIEIDITIEAATASQEPLVTEACSVMLLLP